MLVAGTHPPRIRSRNTCLLILKMTGVSVTIFYPKPSEGSTKMSR